MPTATSAPSRPTITPWRATPRGRGKAAIWNATMSTAGNTVEAAWRSRGEVSVIATRSDPHFHPQSPDRTGSVTSAPLRSGRAEIFQQAGRIRRLVRGDPELVADLVDGPVPDLLPDHPQEGRRLATVLVGRQDGVE